MKVFDCIIVGAGPAGIFAAMELTRRRPETRVVIVDIGVGIDARVCPARKTGKCAHCQPCAILHGWSGAGAFSDGKLSLSPDVGGRLLEYMSRERAQKLIDYVDSRYLECGADSVVYGREDKEVERIAYEAARYDIQLVRCPVRHLGTEYAFEVLREMYLRLAAQPGFTYMDRTTALKVLTEGGRVTGLLVRLADGREEVLSAPAVVAAPGRAGAQWLTEEAHKIGVETINNEVDIGVRVEVSNAVMDTLTKHLYEAKLVYYSDTYESKVRTFCMNPGGEVSGEFYEGGIAVVNGHSYGDPARRTENTNFALLVSSRFTEPFNDPIAYGQSIARLGNMLTGGGVMVQRLGDLQLGRRTTWSRLAKSTVRPTLPTAVPGDLSFVLPSRHLTSILEALKAFDNLTPGLYSRNTLLYGVEVKFYSSKLKVDNRFMTPVEGFYAIGDGAGITRGLMQASVTGVVVARDLLGMGDE